MRKSWRSVRLAATLLLLAGPGHAATAVGTLITNVVSATMWDNNISRIPYEVSYSSTAVVLVVPPPRLEVYKFASVDGSLRPLVLAGTDAIVTFFICVVNTAVDSAQMITLDDMLPPNMALEGAEETWINGNYYTGPVDPGLEVGHGPALAQDMLDLPGEPIPVGQETTYYLRWTIRALGTLHSVCVTYRARVL